MRVYQAAMDTEIKIFQMSKSLMEAEESPVWLESAFHGDYISKEQADTLVEQYAKILGQLVTSESKPHQWSVC